MGEARRRWVGLSDWAKERYLDDAMLLLEEASCPHGVTAPDPCQRCDVADLGSFGAPRMT
jgi:hypothetical protein